MSSTFSGISRALTGLQVQRRAMDVAGQNVTNANTPGYTRQRVDTQALAATGSTMVSGTPRDVGDGVEVTGVVRLNDTFLDTALRAQTSTSAELAGRAATLASLETLTREPTDDGLAASLDDMWASWQDLSNQVGTGSEAATRQVVVEKTATVIDALASARGSVTTLMGTTRAQAEARVTDVNSSAAGIADLNHRIRLVAAAGGDANDLMDQRDAMVLHLSQVTGATARQGADGATNVYVGGTALVAGDIASKVALTAAGATPVALQLLDRRTGAPTGTVTGVGGQLAADLDALTTTLPGAAAGYDAIASSLATSVNALHSTGYDAAGGPAGDLFTTNPPTSPPVFTAANLALAITSPSQLAAAAVTTGGATSDGSLADRISQLQSAPGGPNAAWRGYVARLGVDAASATTRSTTAAAALRSATADQQSASGVSLDEETANLLVLQRAYEGAARVMTAVDQALDTLIHGTGLVGR